MTESAIHDELERRARYLLRLNPREDQCTLSIGCAEIVPIHSGVWVFHYSPKYGRRRIYSNDMNGKSLSMEPEVDLVLADLRQHMVLDDLAAV